MLEGPRDRPARAWCPQQDSNLQLTDCLDALVELDTTVVPLHGPRVAPTTPAPEPTDERPVAAVVDLFRPAVG